jgi:hypothetical protein
MVNASTPGAGGQFAIDSLHYPLFWAAFHPGLGCFSSSSKTAVVRMPSAMEVIDPVVVNVIQEEQIGRKVDAAAGNDF